MTAPLRTAFSIRDLVDEFGVTARALRFYEDKGLLAPHRSGQTRVYSQEDRARLFLILRGKRVGFSLDDIKEMLDVRALDPGRHDELARVKSRFLDRIQALREQRDDIDAAIAELEAGCDWLDARLEQREPPEHLKKSAAAFEALARARLIDAGAAE